jgi:hypothetical protein
MQQQAVTVGTSPIVIAEPGLDGVLLQADPGNDSDIYIGQVNVTADASATGGIRLPPGASVKLVLGDRDFIYAVAPVAGQLARILYPLVGAVVDFFAGSPSAGGFPQGATPVSGANTGAAAAITATLAGAAGKLTYISGFHVTGLGATAGSVIAVTVTGLLGGTQTYNYTVTTGAGLASGNLDVEFGVALPASALNTAIVVNVPSFGAGNTAEAVSAHGYQQ